MSLSPMTKVTLEEYLHAHQLQKKLEYRSKSKSKRKESAFEIHQKSSLNNIHSVMDNWSYQFKLDLHQFLLKDPPKQKVLFYLITNLDKFVLRVKEEIRNMYKEAEMHYNVEHIHNSDPKTVEYFRQQHDIADLQIKKANLVEVMKQKVKDDKKKDALLDAIFLTTKKLSKKESNSQSPGQVEEDDEPVDFISAMLGISKKPSQKVPQPKSEPQIPPKTPTTEPERQNNFLGALIQPPRIQNDEKKLIRRKSTSRARKR